MKQRVKCNVMVRKGVYCAYKTPATSFRFSSYLCKVFLFDLCKVFLFASILLITDPMLSRNLVCMLSFKKFSCIMPSSKVDSNHVSSANSCIALVVQSLASNTFVRSSLTIPAYFTQWALATKLGPRRRLILYAGGAYTYPLPVIRLPAFHLYCRAPSEL